MIDEIIHGDALDVLSTIPDNTVDSIVTDPPSSIKFMGKTWDNDKGGVDGWITWLSGVMREAMRVLKPGGHAYIWALPRTSYMTGYALHKAGFEIRDCVVHLFGTGFPKSHNISKAIDAHFKAERQVVGKKAVPGGWHHEATINDDGWKGNAQDITAPATPEALAHEGEGTALKPASEHWWLCRKPLSEPTIAKNVLKWGTGGLNIDKTRIGNDGGGWNGLGDTHDETQWRLNKPDGKKRKQGRWPANVIMSHSLFCVQVGTRKINANRWGKGNDRHGKDGNSIFFGEHAQHTGTGFEDKDGMEEIEDWECSKDCPIWLLGQQSGLTSVSGSAKNGRPAQGTHYDLTKNVYGVGLGAKQGTLHNDQGTAARYFHTFSPDPFLYVAKPSRRERNLGLEELPERAIKRISGVGGLTVRRCPEHNASIPSGVNGYACGCPLSFQDAEDRIPVANTHPTVKSLALMSHLIRQITPAGGIVLDCFAGSGSTCVAAIAEGYHFIGIEQSDTPEEPYVTIARARIQHAQNEEAAS